MTTQILPPNSQETNKSKVCTRCVFLAAELAKVKYRLNRMIARAESLANHAEASLTPNMSQHRYVSLQSQKETSEAILGRLPDNTEVTKWSQFTKLA